MLRWGLVSFAMTVLVGCSKTPVSMEGRPCVVAADCIDGYVCNAASDTCVRRDTPGDCVSTGTEACDGDDNDCDGIIDNDGAEGCTTFYPDLDEDGFGSEADAFCLCNPSSAPVGSLTSGGDCDDDPDTCGGACNPGEDEVCDGFDNDCDSTTSDDDEDVLGCATYYLDADGDTYGRSDDAKCLCGAVGDYGATRGGDCDDASSGCGADCHPGQSERCDGFDNDCSVATSESDVGLSGCVSRYRDADGDGFGLLGSTYCVCAGAPGYSTVSGDCDDNPAGCGVSCYPRSRQGTVDACNTDNDGLRDDFDRYDNDCDGLINNGAACVAAVGLLDDDALNAAAVTALAVGSDGTVYIGTTATGVLGVLAPDESVVTTRALVKARPVSALLVDGEDGLWVGFDESACDDDALDVCECGPTRTASNGSVIQYCGDLALGSENGARSFGLGPGGRVYVGMDEDYGYVASGSDTFECDVDVDSNPVRAIAPTMVGGSSYNVYAATSAGVYTCSSAACSATPCVPLEDNATEQSAFPGARALVFFHAQVASAADDVLFIGTGTRLYRFDPGAGAYRNFDSIITSGVSALAADPTAFSAGATQYLGTLFVGSLSGGVSMLAVPEAIAGSHVGFYFGSDYGVPGASVTALAYDAGSGRLYVGTSNAGVFFLEPL